MKKQIAAWVSITAAFLAFTAAMTFASADSAGKSAAQRSVSAAESVISGAESTFSVSESVREGAESTSSVSESVREGAQSAFSAAEREHTDADSAASGAESLPPAEEGLLYAVVDGTSDIAGSLAGVDEEELKANLRAVLKVVQSEDFQSLLSYQEVKELVYLIIDKTARFIQAEPELMEEILVTAGLNERFVGPVMIALNTLSEKKVSLDAYLDTEVGKQAAAEAERYLEDPEIQSMISGLAAALEGSSND